ncbi:MAG: T9SS type A sorting domain-containing protein [Flavobacteriales bacterium]|nr:T9SS type A sorting domain-containing protein [Flavobacteriales bacterium]
MRVALFSVALLANFALAGQDWALLNPAYRYNYSNDGSDTISTQIRVTDIDTLGVDSFRYELNLIVKECDTCTAPGLFLLLNQPQFMQRKVNIGPTAWHFHDPGSFVLLPQANLGESWTYDTLANITASVSAVETAQVFGSDVLQKVITLSSGDSIVISEPYGVLSWSGHELIGTHGPDVGSLLPSLLDLFPYQTGDVLEYSVSESGYNGTTGYQGSHRRYKFTVASGNVLASGIEYNGQYIEHRWDWSDPDGSPLYTYGHLTTIGASWMAGAPEFPWSDLQVSYPGQLVRGRVHENIWLPPDTAACIARHWINEAGERMIGCQPICFPDCANEQWTLTFGLPILPSPDNEPVPYYPIGYTDAFEPDYCNIQYRAGLGFEFLHGCYFEWGESYQLFGAVINGDTIGNVSSDESIIALSVDDQSDRTTILSPNPASDRIQLTRATSGSMMRITDLNGRLVTSHTLTSANETIDVQALQPGAYLLVMDGVTPQRFMIVR